MNNQQSFRATIQAVPQGEPRPLWSVMIPTYNCADYLHETLASVLAQAPEPELMQIEVVDDCSTKDDPEAVVRKLGGGRVKFYRQPQNVGFINNFETCLQRSRGHLVHLLHGDDTVRDGFYRKMQHQFEINPEIGATICRHIYMDEHGHWQGISPLEQPNSGILNDWLEKIASGQRITTPSIVVRRDVYEKLGGFDRRFCCTGEDWEMWVRIATEYPVAYEVEPLAVYRLISFGSLTQNSVRNGKFFQDLRQANKIIQSYLPNYLQEKKANKIAKEVGENYAVWTIANANKALSSGELKVLIVQIRETLKFSRSIKTVKKLTLLCIKIVVFQLLRIFTITASPSN
jgi:glycosyltransferase involved in cell wall biosynthesis